MSIDAITYVKTFPPGTVPRNARAVLMVIAENTFNDSGVCVVGTSVLCTDADLPPRTLTRRLGALETKQLIRRRTRGRSGDGGGRLTDAIELVGFVGWLRATRGETRSKPQKTNAASLAALPEKPGGNAATSWPQRCGHMVAASTIESRTDSRTRPPTRSPRGPAAATGGGGVDVLTVVRTAARARAVDALLAPVLAELPLVAPDAVAALGALADEAAALTDAELATARTAVLTDRTANVRPSDIRRAIHAARQTRATTGHAATNAPPRPQHENLHGEDVREQLCKRLGRDVFAAWFSDMAFEMCAGNDVVARARDSFKKRWVQQNYETDVLVCVRQVWPGTVSVIFATAEKVAGGAP